jgi:hypothetical protein
MDFTEAQMGYSIKVVWAGKVWNAVVEYGIGYVPTLDLTFSMTPDMLADAMLGQAISI